MKWKLVKLKKFSGALSSIYTVYLYESNKTLFDIFLEENKNLYLSELLDIISRLKVMGNKTGAREEFLNIKKVIQETEYVHYMMNQINIFVCIVSAMALIW